MRVELGRSVSQDHGPLCRTVDGTTRQRHGVGAAASVLAPTSLAPLAHLGQQFRPNVKEHQC
jgi:hypothetical protein